MSFLDEQAAKYPDLAAKYNEFKSLESQKLWHQLTVELIDFILDEKCKRDTNIVDLYENFVSTFEEKINQLKLVQICTVASRQFLKPDTQTEDAVEKAIEFLEKLEAKSEDLKFELESKVVLKSAIIEVYLLHPDAETFLSKARESLAEIEAKSLPLLAGLAAETVAKSCFYRVALGHRKIVGPAAMFYRYAVQFLAFTPLDALSAEKRVQLAKDTCYAALIAEDVFNFGEVLPQPILGCLKETEFAWLLQLLQAFHEGNIDAFAAIYKDNQDIFEGDQVLSANLEILRQKIGIMALLRIVFERVSDKRVIDLDFIAKEVKLESKMAEWLVMRAMAKGLIRGKIDGVARTVTVDWLKPRVLTVEQLDSLQEKLGAWRQKVDASLDVLATGSSDLFN